MKKTNTKTSVKSEKAVGQKKVIDKTIQDCLKFEEVYDDGLIKVDKDTYSKLYELIDSNFITEPEDKQEDLLVEYTKFVNKFPENVDIILVIVNKKNTTKNLADNYHIKPKGISTDRFCEEYNKIIDKKITEGHSDIEKNKYIILSVRARSLDDAKTSFNTLDIELDASMKRINKVGVKKVDTFTRLSLMSEILKGNQLVPFEKEFGKYKSVNIIDEDGASVEELDRELMKKNGITPKDLIAPQTIEKCSNKGIEYIRLGDNRVCRTFSYVDLPQSLDTKFLTDTTNLPYEMVTTIRLGAVPRKTAIRNVKMMNTSIKADVMKASKNLYREGCDPSLMNEDLVQARNEAAQLRKDVVVDGKKLFYATITITLIAEDEAELKDLENQYVLKCGDYSVNPNNLRGQQKQGLLSSLLLGNKEIAFDRALTSDDCCALFPFNIQELTDKRGHFYGVNAISKNMIMYDRKRSKLANGLVFGQSGSGKSFITKGEIIPNLLDGDDDMIILDPENEYRVIAEAFGGNVVDLEPNSDLHINPCDMSMEWSNPKASPLVEKCDYMVGIVESILGKGRECNSFEVNVIHRAVNKMYEEYISVMTERRNNGDIVDIDTSISPTLVDFYDCLLADNTPEGNKIAMAVEPYCIGNYNLFAHKTNFENKNRLTVFNLLYLPEKMKEMAMKVCLSNIWTTIVRNKENNEKYGKSKAIWVYLDEFHLFFQTESSATTIMAYFKRVRKYNGIMTGITQDVADLLKSSQGTAMFNNTGFFIFLNQSPVGRSQIQQLYNVSDALIDFIKEKPAGMGLIYNNSVLIPFDYKLPKDNELYRIMSTNPNDENRKPLQTA